MGLLFNRKNKGGLWNATFGEIIATFQILEKNGLTLEMLKQIREKGGEEKAKKIVALFLEAVAPVEQMNSDYANLKLEWQNFYKKYFDISIDLSAVKIPIANKDFKRLLIIIPGITPNSVATAQGKHYETWAYTNDLDSAITHNDRDAVNGPYAIWVRDTVEVEQKYRNRSANWANENKVLGETLLERLIHGFKYWDEKKKHLDINSWTLCGGSRSSGGRVPHVDFDSDDSGVGVGWSHPSHAYDSLGLRELIACES